MKFLQRQMKKEAGSSLLYVILISGLLLVIVFSISSLTLLELATTQINEKSQQAFYAAETGLERALYAVQQNPAIGVKSFVADVAPGVSNYASSIGVVPPSDTTTETNVRQFRVTLAKTELRQIPLYDPNDLAQNLFDPVTQSVTVSIACESQCAPQGTDPKPGLEFSTLSFQPSSVGRFNVAALLDSNIAHSTASTDESNINIARDVVDDVASIPSRALLDVATWRYMLQLKALRAGATYVVTLSAPLRQTNVIPVVSYGEATGNRRAIEMVLSSSLVPKSLFDYVIFENDSIEKFAK